MALKMPVTIKQVAEAAGVSIQTVSRVINNRYDVAPETRRRVQDAIDQLGYQPNALARGLALSRSRTLGLVTYDFNDYAFTQVVTGAEQEAHLSNYFLILGNSNCEPDEEPKYLRLLTERHVEGVLFARQGEGSRESSHLSQLKEHGTPVVMTGSHIESLPFHVVDVDNQSGGYQATRCLIDHGHRQIACITGPLKSQSAEDRLIGYQRALEEVGIPFDLNMIVEGEYHHPSGYRGMKALLQRGVGFTAIFIHNDRMAIGAISALTEVGLHVPNDISIVGYDDIPEAAFSNPPLTTIRQPMVEVGREAVRMLMDLIQNPQLPPRQVFLGVELIRRNSVSTCKPV